MCVWVYMRACVHDTREMIIYMKLMFNPEFNFAYFFEFLDS